MILKNPRKSREEIYSMASIQIRVSDGKDTKTFPFEAQTPLYNLITLFMERLNPFLPPDMVSRGYTIQIFSAETLSGGSLGGISLSKIVNDGACDIQLLDETDQPIDIDQQILDQEMINVLNQEDIEHLIVIHEPEVDFPAEPQSGKRDSGSPSGNEEPETELFDNTQAITGVKIRIWEDAFKKARQHARQHCQYEVGGICMGWLGRQQTSGRLVVEITDTFPALETVNRGASVTFTPDTWSHANRVIDRDYANSGESMVGWYHTHPGFGIYLSSLDLFIHRNFFTQSWHIALVIDPIAQTYGFFGWSGDPLDVRRLPDSQIEILPGRYPRSDTSPVIGEAAIADTMPEAVSPDTVPDVAASAVETSEASSSSPIAETDSAKGSSSTTLETEPVKEETMTNQGSTANDVADTMSPVTTSEVGSDEGSTKVTESQREGDHLVDDAIGNPSIKPVPLDQE